MIFRYSIILLEIQMLSKSSNKNIDMDLSKDNWQIERNPYHFWF